MYGIWKFYLKKPWKSLDKNLYIWNSYDFLKDFVFVKKHPTTAHLIEGKVHWDWSMDFIFLVLTGTQSCTQVYSLKQTDQLKGTNFNYINVVANSAEKLIYIEFYVLNNFGWNLKSESSGEQHSAAKLRLHIAKKVLFEEILLETDTIYPLLKEKYSYMPWNVSWDKFQPVNPNPPKTRCITSCDTHTVGTVIAEHRKSAEAHMVHG